MVWGRTCVVVAPGERVARPARETAATALAAPGPPRHVGELRAGAVGVPRGVAIIAQQQQGFVAPRTAPLAHRAIEATPTQGHYHLRYLHVQSTVVDASRNINICTPVLYLSMCG